MLLAFSSLKQRTNGGWFSHIATVCWRRELALAWAKMLTRSESVYACNVAICTNRYGLQRPDTKAPGNTTEREVYNACNEITRVKLGGAHDLT